MLCPSPPSYCRYGFNPGSALMIMGTSGLVARAAITTTLGGGAGGLASLFTNMVGGGFVRL